MTLGYYKSWKHTHPNVPSNLITNSNMNCGKYFKITITIFSLKIRVISNYHLLVTKHKLLEKFVYELLHE